MISTKKILQNIAHLRWFKIQMKEKLIWDPQNFLTGGTPVLLFYCPPVSEGRERLPETLTTIDLL